MQDASQKQGLSLNPDGSLVQVDPREWLVLFVPGIKKEWWNRFVHKEHTHVLAICREEDGRWLLVESWWTHIIVTTLSEDGVRKYMRWGSEGDVLRVQELHPGESTQMRGWMTCAALTAALLGRKYMVWTPHQLYRKLKREQGIQEVDASAFLQQLSESTTSSLEPCAHCKPGTSMPGYRGMRYPFCMRCCRDIVDIEYRIHDKTKEVLGSLSS